MHCKWGPCRECPNNYAPHILCSPELFINAGLHPLNHRNKNRFKPIWDRNFGKRYTIKPYSRPKYYYKLRDLKMMNYRWVAHKRSIPT